jgi:gamma-glutamyltranspeptidase/glutathione hydrolase/leukotriene-C4 hydrolase
MSSVNIPFGAILASSETGVFLNDQMNDFSMPNVDNVFGVPPSPHNFIQPFKRPLSSSVPVIVERDGEFEMALGGTGGTRITTAVLQVLLNTLSFHLPLDKAVDQPRFHHQLFPNQLAVESAFDTRIAADLQRIGHRLVWSPPEVSQGTVQVIRRFANSTIHAVSDGRKDALASGY